MTIAIICIFIVGYIMVAMENVIKINKTAVLDNMTTAIVMTMVTNKLISDRSGGDGDSEHLVRMVHEEIHLDRPAGLSGRYRRFRTSCLEKNHRNKI